MRALTVSAFALLTTLCFGIGFDSRAAPVVAAAPGELCERESYRWSGNAQLVGVGAVLHTGIEVPVVAGTRLDVVGVSADGLGTDGIAHALSVHVGGVEAIAQSTVPGGLITVRSNVDAALQIAGATVVVHRCASVQSLAPAEVAPPQVALVNVELPETGLAELRQTVIGAAIITIGTSLVMLGRRRVQR